MEFDKSKFEDEFKMSSGKVVHYFSLRKLKDLGISDPSAMPFSARILLESMLRNYGGKEVTYDDLESMLRWDPKNPEDKDIPFKVSRILMQDFTGVPAVVDLAALREYFRERGEDPMKVKPLLPVHLIIDHSVQVDSYMSDEALEINQKREMERNKERYSLLKWAGEAFNGFTVIPPSGGICHQINLERIATCVTLSESNGASIAFPDTLIGTDSHTTMINGLGVLGFGVGGIEAEAALLDQPVNLPVPKILGVKLTGRMQEGVTATDLALTLTRKLREKGVVGYFVEFFGPGAKTLSLPDRATISNMCPEYGATISIFPVDQETISYMRSTGRSDEQLELVEKYYRAQGMFDADYSNVRYSDVMEVDIGTVTPSVSGPSQPKDEVPLQEIGKSFKDRFLKIDASAEKPSEEDKERWADEAENLAKGLDVQTHRSPKAVEIRYDDGTTEKLMDGDVVISAITSCTNTSNPFVMVAAGLLAKKAVELGLKVPRKVKTSLAPGSRVVTDYLSKARLLEYLDKLGYSLVGYGCTTCIGNSGPLPSPIETGIKEGKIATASVLSGNRNFEARIHPDVSANYLMSPPLVIAFGIAGTVLKDLAKEPLGMGSSGNPVFLKDVWPTNDEILEVVKSAVSTDMFTNEYSRIFGVNKHWDSLEYPKGNSYGWDSNSTYIQKPPFFDSFDPSAEHAISPIEGAYVLGVFGDSLSTDHISPAGAIGSDSVAGKYLMSKGVSISDFNTFGSRRGNHEVMMRGTFANVKIKNLMLNGKVGGYTIFVPEGKEASIYDAAMKYKQMGKPSVVIGGVEYGSGSSRDWAAKGPMLLGVKAVIAKSFERIHRSNLVGMGVLPVEFKRGEGYEELAIDTMKPISIGINDSIKPKADVEIRYYSKADGKEHSMKGKVRLDSELDIEYYRIGGVLNYVLDKISKKK